MPRPSFAQAGRSAASFSLQPPSAAFPGLPPFPHPLFSPAQGAETQPDLLLLSQQAGGVSSRDSLAKGAPPCSGSLGKRWLARCLPTWWARGTAELGVGPRVAETRRELMHVLASLREMEEGDHVR